MTTVVGLDEQGESMWREVTHAWADQSAHDRFVQHCFMTGRLIAAGARYRDYLEAHPDETTPGTQTARRMQERVVFLSMQVLVPSSRRQAAFRLVQSPWFVLIVLLGAVAGAILGLIHGAAP